MPATNCRAERRARGNRASKPWQDRTKQYYVDKFNEKLAEEDTNGDGAISIDEQDTSTWQQHLVDGKSPC